jgi:hypothetical protein
MVALEALRGLSLSGVCYSKRHEVASLGDRLPLNGIVHIGQARSPFLPVSSYCFINRL